MALHAGLRYPERLAGLEARDALKASGYAVDWHEYPMQHEVCGEELAEVARGLRTRLLDRG